MERNTKKLASFLHAFGVFAYVSFIAWALNNGQHLFGEGMKIAGTVAFLMLFVFSASVVGLLVFYRPVVLYLEGKKKEAAQFLFSTIGWLFLITLIIFAVRL